MTRRSAIATQECLIIAGQPKAGSTSLFDWLACHPEFRPARIKEARFFLPRHYPVPSGPRYDGQNLEHYLSLFPENAGRILLDASPDYMFCPGFAEVARLLPRARVILVQRDPVERLVSWYRYAAQRGFLPKGAGFDTFLALQQSPVRDPDLPVWRRALDQNRFDHYAAPVLEAFGARAEVIPFAKLCDSPKAVLERICCLAGAEPSRLPDLSLEARNVSSGQASGALTRHYDRLRAKTVYALPLTQTQLAWLRPLSRGMRRLLSRGSQPVARPEISAETRLMLQEAARS